MNKKIIVLTIIIVICLIFGVTGYKIYKKHNANLILVVEKEFLYQATLCHKENNCESIVTLKELYTKNYIKEKLTNPVNKKYYLEQSYVNLITEEIKLLS